MVLIAIKHEDPDSRAVQTRSASKVMSVLMRYKLVNWALVAEPFKSLLYRFFVALFNVLLCFWFTSFFLKLGHSIGMLVSESSEVTDL